MTVKVLVLRCRQCGKEWRPKTKKPVRCGVCKSPYWNREKKAVVRREPGVA